MGDKLKTVLFLIIAGLVLAILFLNSPHPIPLNSEKTDTLIVRKVDTLVVFRAKYIGARIDTVTLHDTTFIYRNDTVHIQESYNQVVAKSDTLWQDSSFFYAEYLFPPVNRFSLTYRLKQKMGNRNYDDIKTDNYFRVGIQAGYGYGIRHKQFDLFLGVGINFNF